MPDEPLLGDLKMAQLQPLHVRPMLAHTGDGALARILNEDSVYVALLEASDQFSTISDDLQSITDRFETAAGWGAVGAFRFAENMEALKHNFLFKSYFEDRGYLEMAPFEIREQALSDRTAFLQHRGWAGFATADRLAHATGRGAPCSPAGDGSRPDPDDGARRVIRNRDVRADHRRRGRRQDRHRRDG